MSKGDKIVISQSQLTTRKDRIEFAMCRCLDLWDYLGKDRGGTIIFTGTADMMAWIVELAKHRYDCDPLGEYRFSAALGSSNSC